MLNHPAAKLCADLQTPISSSQLGLWRGRIVLFSLHRPTIEHLVFQLFRPVIRRGAGPTTQSCQRLERLVSLQVTRALMQICKTQNLSTINWVRVGLDARALRGFLFMDRTLHTLARLIRACALSAFSGRFAIPVDQRKNIVSRAQKLILRYHSPPMCGGEQSATRFFKGRHVMPSGRICFAL
jgi:hypothetical protein